MAIKKTVKKVVKEPKVELVKAPSNPVIVNTGLSELTKSIEKLINATIDKKIDVSVNTDSMSTAIAAMTKSIEQTITKGTDSIAKEIRDKANSFNCEIEREDFNDRRIKRVIIKPLK